MLNKESPTSDVLPLRAPDRMTVRGQLLDAYLQRQAQPSEQDAHLLFSANRWEKSH